MKCNESAILNQRIFVKRIYKKYEIALFQLFHEKVNIFPEHVIHVNDFVFFFVKNRYYFHARRANKTLRNLLANKKVLIIRSEGDLVRTVFSFFPDTYIYDISLVLEGDGKKLVVVLDFIIKEDRGIALGRDGAYIKTVNLIFNRFIQLKRGPEKVEIKCKFKELTSNITKAQI